MPQQGTPSRRERENPEIGPGPSEQGSAAEDADHQKAEQKTAVQIGPQRHQHRKHEPSRSCQAFAIEDDAEQHRACIRRDREIHVRRNFVSGIEQAARKTATQTAIAEAP